MLASYTILRMYRPEVEDPAVEAVNLWIQASLDAEEAAEPAAEVCTIRWRGGRRGSLIHRRLVATCRANGARFNWDLAQEYVLREDQEAYMIVHTVPWWVRREAEMCRTFATTPAEELIANGLARAMDELEEVSPGIFIDK